MHSDHAVIDSSDKFLKVYNDIDSDASVQFDDNGYGARYWYQIDYDANHFHWTNDDIADWIKINQDTKCENILDYYFL